LTTRAVTGWPVWRERRRVLAVLGVVELLALAMPAITWKPVSLTDLDLALLLASLSVTYSLFVVGWEKARRLLLFERTPAMTPDLLAIWCFAAALLLPPQAAATVTVVTAASGWGAYTPAGAKMVYRYVYSVASAVLAATTASYGCHLDLSLAGRLSMAIAAWLLVGAGTTALAMCASGQFDAAKAMLHPRTHRIELITMSAAVVEYASHRFFGLALIWLSLPAAVLIQRYFTTAELRSRDVDARPMDPEAWQHIAKVVVAASETVSVLRIDAADAQAARTVAMLQGGCDAIGSYPDGGLAVLLLDCPSAQADALARRLRLAMQLHKVECSIASASKPRDGLLADDLLAVCEAELVVSRAASRRPADSA
jgi:hypothetical protein